MARSSQSRRLSGHGIGVQAAIFSCNATQHLAWTEATAVLMVELITDADKSPHPEGVDVRNRTACPTGKAASEARAEIRSRRGANDASFQASSSLKRLDREKARPKLLQCRLLGERIAQGPDPGP